MTSKTKALIRRSIYDKNGHILLFQLPNLPLLIFILSSILTRIFHVGYTNDLFKAVAFGSIFTWSWLEIASGLNYFRRILGIAVLVLSIMSAAVFLQSLR